MYQACYPLGPAFANYHLFCCIVQTDLSAELALRSQYQCCFHKISAWRVKDYKYEHGKISCDSLHLKLLSLTY